MTGFHSGPVLARVAPHDLTIQDCRDGWFSVTAWCPGCRVGRDIDLKRLDRWAGRKLLDLVREGRIRCHKCRQTADAISVSSSEMADTVLFWRLEDDGPGQDGINRAE